MNQAGEAGRCGAWVRNRTPALALAYFAAMSDFRLRVFAAVARHLSFTKAGQELFVSQPAVTKHIRELEAQYGQRLLARRGNRVSLTEAGRLLQRHAEAVATSAQQLEAQLLGLRDPEEAAGRLRLGASTTLSQYVAGLAARLSGALPTGAADAVHG